MRRPAGEENDLERCPDPAVAVAVAARVPVQRPGRGGNGSRVRAGGRPGRSTIREPSVRPSERGRRRSARRAGSHRPRAWRKPARCRSVPHSRTSTKGETRGVTPPSSSDSAAIQAARSSFSVAPPSAAPRNSPSGTRQDRICAKAPGRSLTVSSPPAWIRQPRLERAMGKNSSSKTRSKPGRGTPSPSRMPAATTGRPEPLRHRCRSSAVNKDSRERAVHAPEAVLDLTGYHRVEKIGTPRVGQTAGPSAADQTAVEHERNGRHASYHCARKCADP